MLPPRVPLPSGVRAAHRDSNSPACISPSQKSSTPSCVLVCSLLRTSYPPSNTSWGLRRWRTFYIPLRQPLSRFAPPPGRLLSSLLFSFPVSPLRRTPAQLPCYESKGRLFQVCKFEPSSAPWTPKQPPNIPKFSSNSRAASTAALDRTRSVADRSCRSHARNLKL